MLFKYLIGIVALASIVASSPTFFGGSHLGLGISFRSSFDFSVAQQSSYQKCVSTITEVKQPVISSCEAGKVEEVKQHLRKVYRPVEEVSNNFNAVEKVDKAVVVEQSSKFIEVLKRFQGILIVIQTHPQVSAGCHDVFLQFNVYFKSISAQFKSHGVNIHKSIEESGLNLSLWESAGFKFHYGN